MKRGEIWLADLGYTGKVRPVLIMSVEYNDHERAVITYTPRTTRVWKEGRFDVHHKARGFVEGAFAVQLIATASNADFMRRVGQVTTEKMKEVEDALKIWLELD